MMFINCVRSQQMPANVALSAVGHATARYPSSKMTSALALPVPVETVQIQNKDQELVCKLP